MYEDEANDAYGSLQNLMNLNEFKIAAPIIITAGIGNLPSTFLHRCSVLTYEITIIYICVYIYVYIYIYAGAYTIFYQLPVLPGENVVDASYQFASDVSMGLIRSLDKKIIRAEELGICFAELNWEHVRVDSAGNVMLKGVHILYDLPPDQLRPRLEANFRSAAVIVNTLFDGNPPFQIGHLLYQNAQSFQGQKYVPYTCGLDIYDCISLYFH
jgi:hypothetical protein